MILGRSMSVLDYLTGPLTAFTVIIIPVGVHQAQDLRCWSGNQSNITKGASVKWIKLFCMIPSGRQRSDS